MTPIFQGHYRETQVNDSGWEITHYTGRGCLLTGWRARLVLWLVEHL